MMENATLDDDIEDQVDGDESEDGEGSGLDSKKIILFAVVPLFLLIAAGGGLYFSGMLDGFLGKGGEEHASADSSDGHGGDDGHGSSSKSAHGGSGAHFLEIPNMLVNLSGADGQPRYLRLSVQLELENAGDQQVIESVMPRVVDQFQTYLRELRVKDLRGSAGIYRLQVELLARVNQAAYPVEVKDVLFQEILIQ